VLEVAPGPGYLAIALANLSPYRITGLDISQTFVRIATENARQAGVAIDFQHGDVANMPFADASFDFVVCQAAFKNFPDPVAALDEIYRVLRSGGKASILDLRKDAPGAAIDQEVQAMGLSRPNAVLTRAIFRFALLRAAYTRGAGGGGGPQPVRTWRAHPGRHRLRAPLSEGAGQPNHGRVSQCSLTRTGYLLP
jgi:ubiquinone/menaquinone biosynthesis C-methylase UbiE